MIISKHIKPSLQEFEDLVINTTKALNQDAMMQSEYYRGRDGRKLEQDVKDMMGKVAVDTPFEGTIELIGGQKFPDVVAKKYYGVEVKTSTQDHWITTGNSVLESTRVEDVEHIFLIFGKLAMPIEFRARKYQDCLSDVVVTHYPRYRINMELPIGETIFDKMGIAYDVMRNLQNPIAPVVSYYKNGLKEGESLWWIDNVEAEQQSSAPMTVRLWKTLGHDERKKLIVIGMVHFSEIFGISAKKYDRFTLWLVTAQSIVSTSMRDAFTAGGKVDIATKYGVFRGLPQIYEKISILKDEIKAELENRDIPMHTEYSGVAEQRQDNRLQEWIGTVARYSGLECEMVVVLLQGIFDL